MSLVLPRWSDDAESGRTLFNERKYFEAHEAWEDEWNACSGHVRTYYQGLILVAAGLLKAQRGESVGAQRLLTKALQKLHGVAPVGSPVATGAFIENAKSALARVDRLGPDGIGRFDHYFPLRLRGEEGPGLRITRWPEDAARGVVLFDEGQWWESHEYFEEVLAEAPGEESLLFKALIHAGSCLHKLQGGHLRPARTLGESALRLLDWLDPVEFPAGAGVRLDGLKATLKWVLSLEGLPDPVPKPQLSTS